MWSHLQLALSFPKRRIVLKLRMHTVVISTVLKRGHHHTCKEQARRFGLYESPTRIAQCMVFPAGLPSIHASSFRRHRRPCVWGEGSADSSASRNLQFNDVRT